MKMHPETLKFFTIVYSLVIVWCCIKRANGDTEVNAQPLTVTYSDSTSDLLKVLSGVQNEKRVKSSNSILSMNMNAGSINFNVPFASSGSKTNEPEHKAPINNVRDDYTLTEGIGYHKFHKTKLNWNDARKACMAENAHLTVINSAEEEELLRLLVADNADESYAAFIGAHDIFEEGDWVTVTGESLEKVGYKEWATGEPNDAMHGEDCAVVHKYYGMNDVPCYFRYYYICEIPLTLMV